MAYLNQLYYDFVPTIIYDYLIVLAIYQDYFYNKFRKCFDNNIILVSIFETYWLNSEYTIKNYLYDLFNNIENDISYYNGYINNNYPIPNIKSIIGEHIVDCYNFDGHTIYTCGYTKLT